MEAVGRALQRPNKGLSAAEHMFFFEGRAKGQDLEGLEEGRPLLPPGDSSRDVRFVISALQTEE